VGTYAAAANLTIRGTWWLDQVSSGPFTSTVQVYCPRTTLGSSGDFVVRNSVFVPSNHDRLIYEMPGFQRPAAWLKEINHPIAQWQHRNRSRMALRAVIVLGKAPW